MVCACTNKPVLCLCCVCKTKARKRCLCMCSSACVFCVIVIFFCEPGGRQKEGECFGWREARVCLVSRGEKRQEKHFLGVRCLFPFCVLFPPNRTGVCVCHRTHWWKRARERVHSRELEGRREGEREHCEKQPAGWGVRFEPSLRGACVCRGDRIERERGAPC